MRSRFKKSSRQSPIDAHSLKFNARLCELVICISAVRLRRVFTRSTSSLLGGSLARFSTVSSITRRASASDWSLLNCAETNMNPGSCNCSEDIRADTAFLLSTRAFDNRPVATPPPRNPPPVMIPAKTSRAAESGCAAAGV